MTVAEAEADGNSGGPLAGNPPGARRKRSRWWWLLAPAALLVAAAIVLTVRAATYQPLAYGSEESPLETFPGLPAGHGIRPVNTVGMIHEDFYLPPQRGAFSLFAAIVNNGPEPVTIEAVSIPGLTSSYPIALAGPVRYSWPGMGGSDQIPPPTSRVLHQARLAPGQTLFLGFLVRTSACAQKDGWTSLSSFSVTERFLFFTQTVDIPWGMHGNSLVMHTPGGRPGSPGTFCVSKS